MREERRRAPSLCENWPSEREAIALLGMTCEREREREETFARRKERQIMENV